jgi:hypothetical protein
VLNVIFVIFSRNMHDILNSDFADENRQLTSNSASMSINPGGIISLLIDRERDSRKSGSHGKCLLMFIPNRSSLPLRRSVAACVSSARTSA